jgi:biotin carboxyl carrier protein
MQARVVKLVAGDGQHVTKGETVVEVEAMKMEQSLCAPADGWVRGLSAKVGDEVQRGEVLCRVVDAPPDGRVP